MHANEGALLAAAIKAGLLMQRQAWRATHSDEDGDTYYTLHVTKTEAVREVEGGVEDMDELETLIVPTVTSAATPALRQRWAKDFTTKLDPIGAITEQMAMLYVLEDAQLDVDGAWWNEDLDVYKLSAPRGVIFRARLRSWCAGEIDWADAPDSGEIDEEAW